MPSTKTLKQEDSDDQTMAESPLTDEPEDLELDPTFGTLLDTFKYKASSSNSTSSLIPGRATRRTAFLATSIATRSSPRKRLPAADSDSPQDSPQGSETPTSGTSTPKRKKKRRSQAAGQLEAERYRHLGIPDNLAPNLILIFVGANPGIASGTIGHAFSHPTNHFWRRLHLSGITPTLLQSTQDVILPERYQVGRTDLILRTSRLESDIPDAERVEAMRILEDKVRRYRPEAVCVLSKGTWKMMYLAKFGRALKDSEPWEWGWQEGIRIGEDEDAGWEGARVWIMPSTSGRVTLPPKKVQEGMWMKLGEWVGERRRERGDVVPGVVKTEVVETEVKVEVVDREGLEDEVGIEGLADERVKVEEDDS